MKKIIKPILLVLVAVLTVTLSINFTSTKVNARVVIDDSDIAKPKYDTSKFQFNGIGFKVNGSKAGESSIENGRIKTPVYKGKYIANKKWNKVEWSAWSDVKEYSNNYTKYRGNSTTEYLYEKKTGWLWKNKKTGDYAWAPSASYPWRIASPYMKTIYRYKQQDMYWSSSSGDIINEYAPALYGLYYYNTSRPIQKGIYMYNVTTSVYNYPASTNVNYHRMWVLPINRDREEDRNFIKWLNSEICLNNEGSLKSLCIDSSKLIASELHDNIFEDSIESITPIKIYWEMQELQEKYWENVDKENKIRASINITNEIIDHPHEEFLIVIDLSYGYESKKSYSKLYINLIDNVDIESNYTISPYINDKVYNLSYISDYTYLKNELLTNGKTYLRTFNQ